MLGSAWRKLYFLIACAAFAFPYQSGFINSSTQHAAGYEKSAPAPVKVLNLEALWHDPGDISSLDLRYGPGGQAHAPRPEASYTFEKEDLGGTSTKFYVKDDQGVEWLVKVGAESRPETAATRIVSAMGYFTDEDYFLLSMHVSGMPKLHRKNKSVRKDGTVTNARLKRSSKTQKKLANWRWQDNPFRGSRELDGLRVLMALINNWDLKNINNKIYVPKDFKARDAETDHDTSKASGKAAKHESSDENDKERGKLGTFLDTDLPPDVHDVRYVVSDLGASFGRTGAYFSRSKGKVKDFAKDPFILATTPETVSFVMRTKPAGIIHRFKRRYYEGRVELADVVQNVPRVHAKWMGEQLARLTPEQLRSAFLAAGFTPQEADGYTEILAERIAELNAL